MAVHDISNIVTGDHFEAKRAADKEYTSFRDIWSFVHGHLLSIGAFTVAGLVLGSLYIADTQPTYTARTRLVMDPEQGRIASQDASTGTIIIEAAEIASQVEIVKSEAIARAVIQQLNLTGDPEILDNSSWQSSLHQLIGWFGIGTQDNAGEKTNGGLSAEEDLMRRTMAAFLARVSVQRVGQSYVLEIGYTSKDPQKAADTANAIAQAYIHTGMDERADAARSGAKWLESRLIEVGRQAREAAMTVEEFRAKNDITTVGNAASLDQQQLSELSTQMLNARAATAAESAKLTTLIRLRESGNLDGNVDETLNNPQIQKIREDMRLAVTKLDSLKSRYDADNPAIAAAQGEIARLETAIQNEFQRIENVYRSNLEVAQTRERLLEAEVAALTESGTGRNLARVELAEMESRATTYRRIYEGILQQLTSALQTQSFPLGKARVVSAATAPLAKTWPKTSVILPFSMALGLASGFLAAILRSGLDRRVSSSERLRHELGIASLGHVPVYKRSSFPMAGKVESVAVPPPMLPLRSVLDMPYSRFSEALRTVKNSVDSAFAANASMVVGITSVGPGEGKTTIATNLAQLYANEGTSVLLIDADFLSARLTRVVNNAGADFGMELLNLGEISRRSAVQADTVTPIFRAEGEGGTAARSRGPVRNGGGNDGASLVPVLSVDQTREAAAAHQRYGHLPALKAEIDMLRRRYKIVIVDMSGFEESADTRVICTYLDGVVVVLGQSDKMTVERLADALATFGKSRIALLGVVSNRSDGRRRRARHHDDHEDARR